MTRRFVLLIALALLAGCATRGPVTSDSAERGPWQDQVARVQALTSWTLAGKVGLKTAEESTSANLDWRHTPNYYRLLISGPFGAGRSTLEGTAEKVTLTTGEGHVSAASAEALLDQQLGCSLPLKIGQLSGLSDGSLICRLDTNLHRLCTDRKRLFVL